MMGVDVVLHPGFSIMGDISRPLLKRQKSRMAKVNLLYRAQYIIKGLL